MSISARIDVDHGGGQEVVLEVEAAVFSEQMYSEGKQQQDNEQTLFEEATTFRPHTSPVSSKYPCVIVISAESHRSIVTATKKKWSSYRLVNKIDNKKAEVRHYVYLLYI